MPTLQIRVWISFEEEQVDNFSNYEFLFQALLLKPKL